LGEGDPLLAQRAGDPRGDPGAPPHPPRTSPGAAAAMRRGLQLSLRLLLSLALLPALVWAALALYFRVPGEWLRLLLPALFAGAALFGLVQLWRRPPLRALLGLALLFGALQLWWQTLEPSNDRDWADDVAETLHGELHGDRLIVHNLRNFDWHGETDYEVRWETREYDL